MFATLAESIVGVDLVFFVGVFDLIHGKDGERPSVRLARHLDEVQVPFLVGVSVDFIFCTEFFISDYRVRKNYR